MSPPYDASSHSTTPPNIFYDSPNPCSTPYRVTNGPPLGFNPISRLSLPSPSITTAMTFVSSAPGISEWLANIPASTSQCISSTGASSNPPAINLPVHPKLSKPVQAHADFSINDLDQLLCTVIDVDPYIAPQKRSGEKWHEVMKCVQEVDYCKGRDIDTLKNKVSSLLSWVEVCLTICFHLLSY